MLDIISSLFESVVSFLETLVEFVSFVATNVMSLFQVFDYIPVILKAPCVMALGICIVLGIKKAVLG